jgi:hypothetical protein
MALLLVDHQGVMGLGGVTISALQVFAKWIVFMVLIDFDYSSPMVNGWRLSGGFARLLCQFG